MYFLLIGAVIITVLIVYIYKKDVGDDEEKKLEDSAKDEIIEPEKPKEIMLYFNTDSVRISFYSSHIFKYHRAKNIYKKIVVEKLYIDEPFHTSLVKLLQIYDKTESWIKSKNTKEIRLKIRKKNGKFEEGVSFKIHSLSDTVFDFLDNIFEYLNEKKYREKDQKNILLAVLIWKIDCVKELKHLCLENLSDAELRECLGGRILKEYSPNHDVFKILRMIEDKYEHIQFIQKIYDNTLRWQHEYPYVDKAEKNNESFSINHLADKNMKQLVSVDDICVY